MSGRACSVCSRLDRPEIDAAIVTAESKRGIARRFAVSPDAVERHARAHVGRALVLAAEARKDGEAETLLSKVERLEADARRLGEKAETEGDLRCALVAVRELLDVARLLRELTPKPEPSPADVRRVMAWWAEELEMTEAELAAKTAEIDRIKAEILAGRPPKHTDWAAPAVTAPALAAPAPSPVVAPVVPEPAPPPAVPFRMSV
jgi:hypothetical protein